MNAKDLRKAADLKNSEHKEFWEVILGKGYSDLHVKTWIDNATQEVTTQVDAFVEAIIQQRAQKGYYRAMIEPFMNIPAVFHTPEVEDSIMEGICGNLLENGFKAGFDRREKRVVLTVSWE